MLRLVFPLFLVLASGFTGLVYQVTWQKYLSIYLGSHAFATSLILSCFFTSLALGYFFLGRVGEKLMKNQFLLYGVIEGLIGVFCLVSPNYFQWLYEIFASVHVSGLAEVPYQFLFCFLYIGGPTVLMGGTIPILTNALTESFDESHEVHAWVYGINTLGAFFGTLMAGFFFIENLGLPMTLIWTSFANLILAVIVYIHYKIFPDKFIGSTTSQINRPEPLDITDNTQISFRLPLYLISFLSGFYVFCLEALIIRMAGLSIGSSEYTYPIIVSGFILAISLGSLIITKLKTGNLIFLIYSQSLLFLSTIFLYFNVESWPRLFYRVKALVFPVPINFYPLWALICIVTIGIILIPVGLMGMNLPLLFNFLRNTRLSIPKTVGHIYAINTLGSAIGAAIGGYVLFYFFDADEIFLVALFSIGITIPLVFKLLAIQKDSKFNRHFYFSFLVLVPLFLFPKWNIQSFVPMLGSRLPVVPNFLSSIEEYEANFKKGQKIIFNEYGPNTVTSVIDTKTDRLILVNGKADASVKYDELTRALSPLIGIGTSPEHHEDIFIAGLGAGLSAAIAHEFSTVKSITVAEIALGVINALPYFDKWNFNLTKKGNKKYQMINGDAYKVLLNQNKKYDIIFSEPSNLWVAGVEKLLTLEYLQQAKKRLKTNGRYVQWFPLSPAFRDTSLILLNNFQSVFKNVSIWSGGGNSVGILIASEIEPEYNLGKIQKFIDQNRAVFSRFKVHSAFDLFKRQWASEESIEFLTKNINGHHTLEFPKLSFDIYKAYFAMYGNGFDKLSFNLGDRILTQKNRRHSTAVDINQSLLDVTEIEKELAPENHTLDYPFQRDRLELLFLKKTNFTKKTFIKNFSDLEVLSYLIGVQNTLPFTFAKLNELISYSVRLNYLSEPYSKQNLEKYLNQVPNCKKIPNGEEMKKCIKAEALVKKIKMRFGI